MSLNQTKQVNRRKAIAGYIVMVGIVLSALLILSLNINP